MRFVKNENYWLGQPKIDEIYLQFVPDDASQTAALVAGDADLGTFPPLSDVPILEAGGVEVIMVQSSGYAEGWFFNFREMASPGANDVNVRQAIAMALDREAINDDLLLGLTQPTETLWDPLAAYGYVSPDIVPWTYDPEGAKTASGGCRLDRPRRRRHPRGRGWQPADADPRHHHPRDPPGQPGGDPADAARGGHRPADPEL